MISKAEHTAGPWKTDDSWSLHGEARPDMMDYRCNVDAPVPFTENEYGDFERVETQTGAIAFGRTPEEAQANARLIAEAFTVAHETDLMPLQLANQRDEFLVVFHELRTALLADHGYQGGLSETTRKRARAIVSAAIAKATAGGA